MIIVTEVTPLGDTVSHKDISYSRAVDFRIDENGNLILYYYKDHDGVPKVAFIVAFYAKGHFSKVVVQ